MSNRNTAELIEKLAAEIGENIYLDIAKWHLYLSNAHLHTVVAEKLYPMLTDGQVEEAQVSQVLQEISVKIGGGRRELPLSDFLPMQCQVQLIDILEEFLREI